MSQNTVRMTFFNYCCPRTFSLLESTCVSTPWTAFSIQSQSDSLFVKIFLPKHSSANYSYFAIQSHQKFDDRHLFKPGAISLIRRHFELRQKKYPCKIRIKFAINPFQTCRHYIYGQKFWKKKNYFAFFSKNILFYLLNYSSKFDWLADLFYGVSTLFGSFNAESSHFDKSLFVSRSLYLQIFYSWGTLMFRHWFVFIYLGIVYIMLVRSLNFSK